MREITAFLGVFVLFFCLQSDIFAEISPDLIKQLQSVKRSSFNNEDRKGTLENQKNIVVRLHELFFTDTETMLPLLGDDNFIIREFASKILSTRNIKNKEIIKKYSRSTKDPEIRMRCKDILKAMPAGEDTITSLMKSAFFIVFNLSEYSDQEIDFLKCYFNNFKQLDKTIQALLPLALKKCKNRNELIKEITKAFQDDNDISRTELWEKGLKLADPEGADLVFKKIKVEKSIEELDLLGDGNPWREGHSRSSTVFRIYEKKLNSIPDFKLVRDDFTKKCFASGQDFAIILGVRLMRHNPEGLVDYCAESFIKASQTNFMRLGMLNTQFNEIDNRKKLFRKYIDSFLDSKISEIFEFGLYLIDNPEKYKKRLIKKMLQTAPSMCVNYLKCMYPKDIPEVTRLLIEKIKNFDHKESDACKFIRALSHLDYRGDDFNLWALNQLKNGDIGIDFSDAVRLNIEPRIIVKIMANRSSDCYLSHNDYVYLLENVKKEDTDIVIDFIIENMEKNISPSIFPLILTKNPNFFNSLIDVIKKEIKKNKTGSFNTGRRIILQAELIAEFIKKHPAMIKEIKSLRRIDNRSIQLFTSIILFINEKEKGEYANDLISQLSNHDSPDYVCTILRVFIKNAEKKDIERLLSVILKKYPNELSSTSSKLFTNNHKYLIPLFINYLNDNIEKSILPNINIIEAALNIEKENDKMISLIKKLITIVDEKGNTLKYLELMTSLNQSVTIPADKYKKWGLSWGEKEFVFAAMQNSDVNIPGARAFFNRFIIKGKIPVWSFCENMHKSTTIKTALLPLIFESLPKNKKAKNAVNVLKEFPDYLKQNILKIRELYSKANKPAFIDRLTFLIGSLEIEGAPFIEDMKRHYSKIDDADKRKTYYRYAMARISPDKSIRKIMTEKFISSMKQLSNDRDYTLNVFLKDSGYIALEFPDIVEPFLSDCFENGYWRKQYNALRAFTITTPYSQTACTKIEKALKLEYFGFSHFYQQSQISYILEDHPEMRKKFFQFGKKFESEKSMGTNR